MGLGDHYEVPGYTPPPKGTKVTKIPPVVADTPEAAENAIRRVRRERKAQARSKNKTPWRLR